jgi:ATP-dependent DNA helicase RecQ
VFWASAARPNLNYHIIEKDDDDKIAVMRELLLDIDSPAIVYVSRVYRTENLAKRLTDVGLEALPYHGQMDRLERIENQEAFMSGEVDTIVATTAFGMGVDKKDVKMVIHYDISDSLENYVQEAGRAGRDENIQADCYILYSDEDLHKHFILLNQTKVTQKEIGQIWRAVREITHKRLSASVSPLEVARAAGWDDSVREIETRAKTAINALEQADFIKRGQNMPRIYADSILVKNMEEARLKIDNSARFDDESRQHAIRIIKNLISAKSKARGMDEEGESRIDYISDILGIDKIDVVRAIGLLREEKILSDAKDLFAFLGGRGGQTRCRKTFLVHKHIEELLLKSLDDDKNTYNIKDMNEALYELHPDTTIKQLHTVINYYHSIKRYISRRFLDNKNYMMVKPNLTIDEIRSKCEKRFMVSEFVIDYLYTRATIDSDHDEKNAVAFSVLELKQEFESSLLGEKIEMDDVEDAVYYLIKINALRIEGGFLVIYNAMEIERLKKGGNVRYKKEHYADLEQHYKNKRQQIHIVGEFARFLLDDPDKAMEYMNDYFVMEYEPFLHKYFKGRQDEINRNITPEKFNQLFGELSPMQLEIIKDDKSRYIVVAAGPGSGKTMLLTHKLASICIMEDIKREQMLMVTFSRAAAAEFKKRLMGLIGNAANFIQIMTFHSYCFDLLGRVGTIEKSDEIIRQTIEKIESGEVNITQLTKAVLVIDEAQDMGLDEYALVKTLMSKNENMRIIAVGDDDQNIYEFRKSSSDYFESFLSEPGARKYELVDNYRSKANIVEFANQFALTISKRFKTTPITPVNIENGQISVCKLASKHVEIPVVNAFLATKPSGTTCIIAQENREVYNIVGLLIKNGVSARQIQTNKGFSLTDLVELRDFMDFVDVDKESRAISEDVWEKALSKLKAKYAQSDDICNVLRLLDEFDRLNKNTKFKSELRQFVRESKLEDFIIGLEGTVRVSTIHQTKGKEFDNVYLALNSSNIQDDAKKRAVYVAFTRAKNNLHILANGSCFDWIKVDGVTRCLDDNDYTEPPFICLELSHESVWLSYFSRYGKYIDTLVSGQKLEVGDTGCHYNGKEIVRFSKKFLDEMDKWKTKGYSPSDAYIRHIVYWQSEESDKEIKIILPNIELSKDEKGSDI